MKRWLDYLVIVLVGLATHGLLLLNDGIYWDGWLVYSSFMEKAPDYLSLCFVGAGRPMELCFHRLMGCFPDIILGYKWVAFLSVVFTAMLVYTICRESNLVNRGESLLIAIMALVYPVFHVGVEMTITAYLFFYLLFFLAVWLAFKSENAKGVIRCLWRAFALVFFFFSFSLNSLLVFFYGFILVLMLHTRQCQGFSLRQMAVLFLPRHIDYITLPFLFWVLNGWFFPLSDFYAQWSDLRFNLVWLSLQNCFIEFMQYAFYDQWVEASGNLLDLPMFMLLILLLAYLAYHAFRMEQYRCFSSENRAWYFIVMGVVMFVAGVFPYLVVGARPRLYSWETRHALLLGLPMALILVGLFRLVFSRHGAYISRLGFIALVLVMMLLVLSNINAYFHWQSVWIKNRSIMRHLSQTTCWKPVSTFWIDQQIELPGDEAGHFYVWASMLHTSWGDESHIGFPGRFPRKMNSGLLKGVKDRFGRRGYNIATYDPDGPQAMLVVRPGPLYDNEWNLAARYLYLKHFRPGKTDDFLSGVTRVRVGICPRDRPAVITGE